MQTLKLQPLSENHELGEPVAAIGTGVGLGKKLIGGIKGIFGGKKESQADLTKQDIQKELANKGFPQFSKMSGFKGNEKQKRNAMRTVFQAVVEFNMANQVTQWLENGNITPGTISKIESRIGNTVNNQVRQQNNNLPANTAQAGFLSNVSTPVKIGAAVVLTGLVFANRKQIGKAIS